MPLSSSRETIYNTIYAMMEDLPYKKITVSSVVKQAKINRSTFYKYFADMQDAYDQMCHELIGKLLKPFEQSCFKYAKTKAALIELIIALKRESGLHMKQMLLLSGKNGDHSFLVRLRNAYHIRFRSVLMRSCLFDEQEVERISAVSSDIYAIMAFEDRRSEYMIRDIKLYCPDFQFDMKSTVAENVARYLSLVGLGDAKRLYETVIPAFLEACLLRSLGGFDEELFRLRSGFSEEEYNRFFHDFHMPEKVFYSCFVQVITLYALIILRHTDEDNSVVLKAESEVYRNISDDIKKEKHEPTLMDFYSSVYRNILFACAKGDILPGCRPYILKIYICDILRCLRLYLVSHDSEAFTEDIRRVREDFRDAFQKYGKD